MISNLWKWLHKFEDIVFIESTKFILIEINSNTMDLMICRLIINKLKSVTSLKCTIQLMNIFLVLLIWLL